MTFPALFAAASILLLAAGLATWAWFAMAQLEIELRSLSGFEGMHFEIAAHETTRHEALTQPIPG